MAYQTGISVSVADLVSAVIAFATANGWTTASSWSATGNSAGLGSATYTVQPLLKGGVYVLLQYHSQVLMLNTATGINGSGIVEAQPGACPGCQIVRPIVGPHVGYHLFTDGMVIHVAVEVATGAFTHFNFGDITKNGTWVGGRFVAGSCTNNNSGSPWLDLYGGYSVFPFWTPGSIGQSYGFPNGSAHIRSNIGPNPTALFGGSFSGADVAFCSAWATSDGKPVVDASPNMANGRSVIMPINIVQGTTAQNGPFYQLGTVPNVGVLNIKNIAPKSVVNTDWMVFPVGQKNGPASAYINSGNYAIAYKK